MFIFIKNFPFEYILESDMMLYITILLFAASVEKRDMLLRKADEEIKKLTSSKEAKVDR